MYTGNKKQIVLPPIYPRLGNNEVVTISGEKYRAEFWQGHKRFYEFIYLGENGKENFTRSEIDVSNAIIEKKIRRS